MLVVLHNPYNRFLPGKTTNSIPLEKYPDSNDWLTLRYFQIVWKPTGKPSVQFNAGRLHAGNPSLILSRYNSLSAA